MTSGSARFLAPQSPAEFTLRKALISLARRHEFARIMVNTGRMSVASDYPPSTFLPQGGVSVQNVPITLPDGRPGSPGFGIGVVTASGRAGSPTDAAFDRRQGDSVQYWTPNWAGFSARLAYSANEGKSPDNAVPEINPYLWSVSATYQRGPLYGSVAYERHIDHFGLTGMGVGGTVAAANDSSRDQAVKATLGYPFGNTLLAALWERLEYENDDNRLGNVDEYERDAWSLQHTHRIGAYAIRAAYTKVDEGECDRVGGCRARRTRPAPIRFRWH